MKSKLQGETGMQLVGEAVGSYWSTMTFLNTFYIHYQLVATPPNTIAS